MDAEKDPVAGPVPITEAIRDAQEGFRDLLRSEIHLAAIELKAGVLGLTRRSKLLLAFSALAIWGALPLTAFVVIGLGELLGHNYWLSSLILGGLAVLTGGLVCLTQLQRIKNEDISLRRTRRTIGRKLRRVA